jgi:hypothetical protein
VAISTSQSKKGSMSRFMIGATTLVVITLITAGCLFAEPDQGAATVPANAENVPTEQTAAPTLSSGPQPAPSAVIPLKNITIQHPRELTPVTGPAATTINGISDPRTFGTVNGYLRWESARARTNASEAARINGMINVIDAAIGYSSLNEDLILYSGISGDLPHRIINDSRYSEPGYVSCTFDPSIVYHTLAINGRDKEGFVTMLVIHQRLGSHILYVNETKREILLPHGMTWELASEEKIGKIEYIMDSTPRYPDEQPEKVRLLYIKQIS